MKKTEQATIKFHKDIHLPARLENAALSILVRTNGRYTLTKHAQERLRGVEWGWNGVTLPERIPFMQAKVVEVTTDESGTLQKALLRFPSGDGVHDLVVSLSPEARMLTVYVNTANDKHRTLNRRVYANKEAA